jgi:TRAP-type C4-dicarboxylate transport system permease small subunit
MIFDAVDRGSAHASRWLCNVGVYGALPGLLVLVTLDVVLRYVFNSPLQWSRDASGLLLLITLFSALPNAWDQGYHIRMEVIHVRMSARWRSVADVVSIVAAFVFFALLVIQAVVFSGYMYSTGETGEDLNAPLWPFMAFVAFCGLVFAARLLSSRPSSGMLKQDGPSKWI